jgi:hypothetical protein
VPVPGHVVTAGSARPSLGQAPARAPLLQRASTHDGTTAGPLQPRLLDLETAARYLALSPRTVRELEHQGALQRVQIPAVRRLLYDRLALDRLIEAWARA